MNTANDIPLPSLRRLPLYYRRLLQVLEGGGELVSSEELGRSANVPGAQVRKDLTYIDEEGRPGIGYDARSLAHRLADFLGLVNYKDAVLAGVGNLGRALTFYPGFERYGLRIVALFDSDPAKVGSMVGNHKVLCIEELTELAEQLHIQMGIITVPASEAQYVADMMVAGGISVIWNFAPTMLAVPEGVLVKSEDLAAELATLSHHIQQRLRNAGGAPTRDAGDA